MPGNAVIRGYPGMGSLSNRFPESDSCLAGQRCLSNFVYGNVTGITACRVVEMYVRGSGRPVSTMTVQVRREHLAMSLKEDFIKSLEADLEISKRFLKPLESGRTTTVSRYRGEESEDATQDMIRREKEVIAGLERMIANVKSEWP